MTLSRLMERAANGDAEASRQVGLCYQKGWLLPVNRQKALVFFKASIEAGNVVACYNAGILYEKGYGGIKDIGDSLTEAEALYSQARKNGDGNGAVRLARLYQKHPEMCNDKKKIKRNLQFGINRGVMKAHIYMGKIYFKEIPHASDDNKKGKYFENAIHSFTQAAENGYPIGYFYIGKLYYARDAERDTIIEAANNFSKAANNGISRAVAPLVKAIEELCGIRVEQEFLINSLMKNYSSIGALFNDLGECYISFGEGEKEKKKGLPLLKTALDIGFTYAMFNIGCCYYYGYGVEKNFAIAIDFLKRAAAQGIPDAYTVLGKIYQQGIGKKQNFEKAASCFYIAAKNGSSTALALMGEYYLDGLGDDEEEGFRYMQLGHMASDKRARQRLITCYELGIGTEVDEEMALYLKSIGDS